MSVTYSHNNKYVYISNCTVNGQHYNVYTFDLSSVLSMGYEAVFNVIPKLIVDGVVISFVEPPRDVGEFASLYNMFVQRRNNN